MWSAGRSVIFTPICGSRSEKCRVSIRLWNNEELQCCCQASSHGHEGIVSGGGGEDLSREPGGVGPQRDGTCRETFNQNKRVQFTKAGLFSLLKDLLSNPRKAYPQSQEAPDIQRVQGVPGRLL